MMKILRQSHATRLALLLILLIATFSSFAFQKPVKEFYKLTIYHYHSDTQERALDSYLKDALLPALHRTGANRIGVFKALANDTAADKVIYVISPYSSLDNAVTIDSKLARDKAYQNAAIGYTDVNYETPNYTRMETILMKIFPLADPIVAPTLKSPKSDRIYELRSYEGASEKIFANKVKMFNEGGEIKLFKRLNFNAIFYSEVIAGGKMPNLMYMTSFENMADRDAHWKTFSTDAEWKQISGRDEYRHNVSHIDITFLRPTEYSDL